ncbi:hypothetical protein [Mobilicoccus sp.]|uniref:hypothetical protein n=1 Tax=Mobilicoccus sp. TaxID=2034349 RepID=UPI0028993EB4|nr:hypothetical protein [Mobilicoccus sp.]
MPRLGGGGVIVVGLDGVAGGDVAAGGACRVVGVPTGGAGDLVPGCRIVARRIGLLRHGVGSGHGPAPVGVALRVRVHGVPASAVRLALGVLAAEGLGIDVVDVVVFLGVVHEVEQDRAVEFVETLPGVRLEVGVHLGGGLEPLTGVIGAAELEQRVGVRVVQPRRPRLGAARDEVTSLEFPQRLLGLAEIPADSGGDDRHLDALGGGQGVHLRRCREFEGLLGAAQGPFAVDHERQQVL